MFCLTSRLTVNRSLQRVRRTRAFSTTKKKQSASSLSPKLVAGLSLAAGVAIGRWSLPSKEDYRVLPSGLPRTCCDEDLTDVQRALPAKLSRVVGKDNVLDGRKETTQTLPFLTGARLGGGGQALAIVTPRSLQDVVQCVKLIVDAKCVILPQGANTGLTGGSVPRKNTNDNRPVVLISLKYLDAIFPIDGGKRVVCMAGAGLATLSRELPEWFPDRESHSILGSTFLNPSTAAGVALGSGGTQLRKGPAYTDRAMYIKGMC